jgi:hypothetical protein
VGLCATTLARGNPSQGSRRRRGGRAIASIPNQLVQALEARREVVAAWDGFGEREDPAGAIDKHGSGDIGLPAFGPYPYCDEWSFATANQGRSVTDSVAVSASPFVRDARADRASRNGGGLPSIGIGRWLG